MATLVPGQLNVIRRWHVYPKLCKIASMTRLPQSSLFTTAPVRYRHLIKKKFICNCTSDATRSLYTSSHLSVLPNLNPDVRLSPISKILVANRGEIACRVMRTARKLAVQTVAVYSDPDENSLHVQMADEAYCIGGAAPQDSYLRGSAILEVAKRSGAQAIHPGYGFLSENAEFAEECYRSSIIFVGPPAQAIRDMGIKSTSKHIMEAAGVPVIGGYHGNDQSDAKLRSEADKIGFPVMIKAVRGGGGKGMRIAATPDQFQEQLESARREALKAFGDDVMLIEKFVERPRHVEVQVFGDLHGNYVYLFERDCSVQRRHQKIVEEAPAPGISEQVRTRLGEAAVAAARAVGYVGAGTVEFIMDPKHNFYFMEMNTRLQVEHPVTEMITGTDLVEWQIRVAAGEPLPRLQDDLLLRGHSFEARVYAEDPSNSFLPAAGRITKLSVPLPDAYTRIETGVREGDEVSVHYDPMIAKLVVWGPDRGAARHKLVDLLAHYNIVGLNTNIDFMLSLLRHHEFALGNVHTNFIDEHKHELVFSASTVLANDGAELEHYTCQAALCLLLSQHRRVMSNSRLVADAFAATGHRLNMLKRSRLELVCGDRNLSVEVEDRGTDATDRKVQLTVLGESHSVKGRLMTVEGETSAQELHVHIDDVTTKTRVMVLDRDIFLFTRHGVLKFSTLLPKFLTTAEGGAAAGVGGGAVAPMPGVVEKILVESGQSVKPGDPLVVIIAMKMEFVIKAAAAGVVEAVLYKKGDTVTKGAALIKFHSDEPEDVDDE